MTDGDAPNDHFAAYSGYTASDMATYARDYAHEDYWTIEGAAKVRASVPMTGDDLAPRARMERTSMYNDFLRQFDVSDCLAMPLMRAGDLVSVLVINGRGEQGRFREPHLALARHVLPHLEHVVAARQRLGGAADALLGARLDALGVGLALFERSGRLVSETPTFARLAAAAGLFRANGRTPFAEQRPAIRVLINRTLASGVGGGLVVHAGELGAVLIRCAPVPPHPWLDRLVDPPGVMVTLEVLDAARERSIDAAAEMWRLSRREREFLRAAAVERSVAKAAAALGMSHETARSHAKRVYAKAGVHSLAELLTAAAAVRVDGR